MIGGAPWLTRRDYPKLVGGLEAWFDETDPSSMIMDSANRVSLIADKSGNSSTNVLCLNGVAGNYASAPDSAPLSITGDITLIAQAMLTDWTPGTAMCLIGKEAGDPQRSYWMEIDTGGTVSINWTTTGSLASALAMTSTAAITVTDLASKWVQVTMDVDNGSAQRVAKFYVSDDGVTWTQLGATVTTAGATSIADTTAVLSIGARGSGGAQRMVTGNIMRARILNGYDGAGTVVFDANFATCPKLASSFIESSTNAAVVTINTSGATGARVSGPRDRYQGTAASQQVYLPWGGTNYGYFNGVDASISTPDSNPLDATTQVEIVAKIQSAAYASATGHLVSKAGASNQSGYSLAVSTGTLFLSVGDGAVAYSHNATSNLTTRAANGSDVWVKGTYLGDNGAGSRVVQFFTSPDGVTWTQLGATITTAGAITIGTNATAVYIGRQNAGPGGFYTGRIYYGSVATTIGAAPVAIYDASLYSSGPTFTASTGEVWTLNAGAKIVTRSGLYSDGVDDYSKTPGFALVQPITGVLVLSEIARTANDILLDGNVLNGLRYSQAAGATTNYITSDAVNFVTNTTVPAVGTDYIAFLSFNGASSSLATNRSTPVTGNAGTASPNGLTFSAGTSGGGPANVFTSEELFFSKVLSFSERSRLALYFARKHRLPAV